MGGSEADKLFGGAGNDLLYGGTAADTLTGGLGADTIFGEGGVDIIYGGDGAADTISGGAGDDALYGGTGDADIFVFNAAEGTDTIFGWENGTDLMDLSSMALAGGFGDLTITSYGGGAGAQIAILGETTKIRLDGALTTDVDALDFIF